ncbi:hypothetical protein L2V44_14030, partial [Staphylococcus aureus]|nr:hypothetical protein [Staphylococcus aureus]
IARKADNVWKASGEQVQDPGDSVVDLGGKCAQSLGDNLKPMDNQPDQFHRPYGDQNYLNEESDRDFGLRKTKGDTRGADRPSDDQFGADFAQVKGDSPNAIGDQPGLVQSPKEGLRKDLQAQRTMIPPSPTSRAHDPLQVPVGPITSSRAKRLKEALNGLIQEVMSQAQPMDENEEPRMLIKILD